MFFIVKFSLNTDEEPPKVTCPSAKTETVVDTEVRTFTLYPAEIVSSDNSGQAPTVEISPQSLTISASFIGTTREMTVTVRDSTGRTDQCRVQVYTAGKLVVIDINKLDFYVNLKYNIIGQEIMIFAFEAQKNTL